MACLADVRPPSRKAHLRSLPRSGGPPRRCRADLEKEITTIATQPPYAEAVEKLVSLRGIAILSAMVLLTEIQDFRRFKNPRELMAYVGLVPSERSSGATRRQGGITKTGNSHARRILVEAAWHYRHPPAAKGRVHQALKRQPAGRIAFARKAQMRLHKRYVRLLAHGKSRQAAVVAVARELCGFVWAAALQRRNGKVSNSMQRVSPEGRERRVLE